MLYRTQGLENSKYLERGAVLSACTAELKRYNQTRRKNLKKDNARILFLLIHMLLIHMLRPLKLLFMVFTVKSGGGSSCF